jgi:hypothetical protein
MRAVRWVVGAASALAVVYGGFLALDKMDLVTSNYATVKEARADQLFARGWLPDILPMSAHDIRVTNDVDINTSNGEFRFLASDYRAFASRLSLYASGRARDFDSQVRKMRARGYEAGLFGEDGSTWLFICDGKRGYCEYTMWLDRVDAPQESVRAPGP